MKKFITLRTTLALLALVLVGSGVAYAVSPANVNLGTAGNFAVLAGSGITNTGTTSVTGDVGISPGSSITGLPPASVSGSIQNANTASLQAQNDLASAYNDIAARSGATTTLSTELGGLTLVPGIYTSNTGAFGLNGVLTLDAQGDPNAVFIIKADSTLTTGSGSNVVLANGAQACNVFFEVGSSATLGSNSTLRGNVLALTSITANTGANVQGRLLARNGAVTLDSAVVNRALCSPVLTVVKTVINDNGGTGTVASFPLFVGTTTVSSGVARSFPAGTYNLSETNASGYVATWGGDCSSTGSITLVNGQNRICTLVNNDIATTTSTTTPPVVIIYPPLVCVAAVPSTLVGYSAAWTATGGTGVYSWNSGLSTGSGNFFPQIYTTPGLKTVTLTSGTQSVTCSVTILANGSVIPTPTVPTFPNTGLGGDSSSTWGIIAVSVMGLLALTYVARKNEIV